jgi:hypothetical protein
MEHAVLALIPIVIVPVVMAVPIAIVYIVMRSVRHKRELLSRERLAAIEKGLDVPLMDMPELQQRKDPSLAGMILVGLGIGLAIFFRSVAPEHGPWGIGVMLALIGVAILAHWLIRGRAEWERDRALDEDLRRAYIDRLRGGLPATTKASTTTVAD